MVVVVAVVGGVAMAVVKVVDVIAMLDGFVAAPRTVGVVVADMFGVAGGFAFVPVPVVFAVQVAIVGVVGVVAVRDFGVAAAGAVGVLVFGVLVMRCGHRTSSFPIAGYAAPSVTTH